jgi:cation:H+ antiporter
MMLVWILAQFAACTALILWSGARLSRYGDMIAEKTGFGGTWVGLLLMAAVTSLPELVTGGSAVVLYDAVDIAAGDAIGSCMFNLVILALIDVRDPAPLSTRIHQGHVLTGAFGILQLGLVALAVVAGPRMPAVGWIGIHSFWLLGIYALAMRAIFRFERRRLSAISRELAEKEEYTHVTLARAILLYSATALVLVAAAAYLPAIGERLAAITGLSQSFVGNVFIAASTSLPEVVVTLAAIRMGALDMAAANLFGSNLFNAAILGIDDLLYTKGIFLASVSAGHLITLASAIMMTAVAIVGLTYRAAEKRYRISWDAMVIVAIYVAGNVVLKRF